MKVDIADKAKTFDAEGSIKRLVDATIDKLYDFRKKYPFAEDPTQIERLTADDA